MKAALAMCAVLGAGCVIDASVGEVPAELRPDAGGDDQPRLECAEPLPCPAAAAGRASICGQVARLKTGLALRAPNAVGAACDPSNPTADGPCSVCINAFSLSTFVVDPVAASALGARAIDVDDCGRFRIADVDVPADEMIAVVAGNCGVTDLWVTTAVPIRVAQGGTITATAMAMSTVTDRLWTESAGNPFGAQSFADVGVYAVTYAHADRPATDVMVTVGGATAPSATFYFDDDRAALRRVDPDRIATGVNGSALVVGSGLGMHGGVGGEPDGCVWPSAMAASVPGAVVVEHKHAVCDP